jgi:autotransporter-associated beta strand protein
MRRSSWSLSRLFGRSKAKRTCKGGCAATCRKGRDLRFEALEERQLLSISWSGLGNNNLWSNGANWVGGVAPTAGADVVFSGSTRTATQNDLSYALKSVTFSSSNFSISGNTVSLTAGITTNSGVSGTSISSGVSFTGSAAVTVGYGSNLSLGGAISETNGLALHVYSGSTMTLASGVFGSGALTLDLGSGSTMTLGGGISGASSVTINDPSGSHLTVNGGISNIGSLTATEGSGTSLAINGGISASGNVTFTESSGSSFAVAGGMAIANLTLTEDSGSTFTLAGGINSTGNVAVTESSGATLTLAGGIVDTGNITVTEGSGATFTLTGGVSDTGIFTFTQGSGATATIGGAVSETGGIVWNVGSGATALLSGNISGSGNLTKTDSGTLTLSGDNTFTGTTTISAGALAITTSDALSGSTLAYNSSGGTLSFGSLTSLVLGGLSGNKNLALTNSSSQAVALTVGGNGFDTTYSGVLSGLGSFIKVGSGALTLGGSSGNTYAGGTTVNDGTLKLAKTSGYAIPGDLGFTLANGYTFVIFEGDNQVSPNSVVTFGDSPYPHLELYGHTVTLGGIQGMGVIENTETETGVGNGTLIINNTADYFFNGYLRDSSGGSGTMSVIKTGEGKLTLDGWDVGDFTGGLTIAAGALRMQNSVPHCDVVDDGALELVVDAFDLNFSHTLSGTGSLTASGHATLTLSGDTSNTYAGGTTVAGTLVLAKTGGAIALPGDIVLMSEIGDGTSTFVVLDGDNEIAPDSVLTFNTPVAWAHLDLNGHRQTLAGINSDAWGVIEGRWDNTSLNTDSQLTINNSVDCTFQGTIRDACTGDGAGKLILVKTGSGTLTITNGGNSYAGGTVVENGTLTVGDDNSAGSLGSGDVTIDADAAVVFDQAGDQTVGNAFSGSGILRFTGPGGTPDGYVGDYDLSGDNSNFAGTIVVEDARIRDDNGPQNFGAAAITVLPGGQVLAETNGAIYYNDITISGAGWLEAPGTTYGALRFGGTTWAGDITLAGDARITAAFGLGTITGNISGNHTLEIGGSGSNDGVVLLTPDNANTFASLKISGGTVQLGDGVNFTYPLAGDIINDGALIIVNAADLTYGGVISGSGSLTKSGEGTLTLTADNTYSGATTVEAGVLQVGDGGASGSLGSGVILDNASLVFDTSSPQTACVVGTGVLTLSGSGDFTLTTPGTPTVTINDPDNRLIPGGVVSVSAETVMANMPVTLTASVADRYGECQSVSFYLDTDGDGQRDAGDTYLGDGVNQDGLWSLTISTTGWGTSTAVVFAVADFPANSPHPPASIAGSGNLDITASTAILSPASASGYEESGDGFSTVWVTNAYGGQYRVMSGSDASAYATYTFTNLVPGNYEVWKNVVANAGYSGAVTIEVFDGDADSGTLQQTFTIDETATSDWSDWTIDGHTWSWSGNFVYSNTGTITVRVSAVAGQSVALPAMRLIAAPDSTTPNCPTTSKDPVTTKGQAWYCGCAGTVPEGASYNNFDVNVKSSTGYGMNDSLPTLVGNGMVITFYATGASSCPGGQWLEPTYNYTPLNGNQSTLQDMGTYLRLTTTDGTVYTFSYPAGGPYTDGYAIGNWLSTTYASGETVTAVYDSAGRLSQISYKTSASAQPYETDYYEYYGSADPNAGMRASITYWQLDSTASALVRYKKVSYAYYVTATAETNGLTGDLKTATTQYWDGTTATWAGGDTFYFRYYTGATYDGSELIGMAHMVKRELLPAAYAKACADFGGSLDGVDDAAVNSQGYTIADYTCFYYHYDVNYRVTYELVYGGLRDTSYVYYQGSSTTTDTALWTLETVETRMDNSVLTTYSNFLNEPLFTDLYDPSAASGSQHTYTYYQYDSDGKLLLQAESSAIAGYTASSNGALQVTANSSGLVYKYA